MKTIDKVESGIFFVVFIAIVAALIVTVVNEAKINIAQVLLTFALVLITFIYAKRTTDIAKASVKMAEEMREQRLSEARPYLLIKLNGEAVQWDKDEKGKPPSREFTITIRNVGKGPAINLWAALWSPEETYFGDNRGYLALDEEWQTNISRAPTGLVKLGFEKEAWLPGLKEVIKRKYPGIVAVKYNDIHKRTWVSYLCFERHVDVESFVLEEEQNIVELKND
ncbi:MAG: hypothetical protein ABIK32_06125 [Chloroflexota bacterium]|nr:hypothetical protein [Chloroflexota bacterium]